MTATTKVIEIVSRIGRLAIWFMYPSLQERGGKRQREKCGQAKYTTVLHRYWHKTPYTNRVPGFIIIRVYFDDFNQSLRIRAYPASPVVRYTFRLPSLPLAGPCLPDHSCPEYGRVSLCIARCGAMLVAEQGTGMLHDTLPKPQITTEDDEELEVADWIDQESEGNKRSMTLR